MNSVAAVTLVGDRPLRHARYLTPAAGRVRRLVRLAERLNEGTYLSYSIRWSFYLWHQSRPRMARRLHSRRCAYMKFFCSNDRFHSPSLDYRMRSRRQFNALASSALPATSLGSHSVRGPRSSTGAGLEAPPLPMASTPRSAAQAQPTGVRQHPVHHPKKASRTRTALKECGG